MEIPKGKLLEIYERMATIRQFEERVREEFAANRIPGFVHLYAGEEAVAVGVCAHLTDEDMITSTHRGHGHCIAKGVDVKAMMAELYGRATGACKGKGGSMHIADLDRGMLGANGIVGAGIPLACGAALSAQVLGTENVAVSFFGDGGANEGSFHEGLNLAGVWQLPAIFVAENNGWAESTSSDYSVAGADIAGRARSLTAYVALLLMAWISSMSTRKRGRRLPQPATERGPRFWSVRRIASTVTTRATSRATDRRRRSRNIARIIASSRISVRA